MIPQSEPASNGAPPAMGEFARLAGVFLDPKPAFADIANRPRWWIPLLLLVAVPVIYIATYSQHLGWERIIQQTFESNPRVQNLTPEQRERAAEQAARFAPIGAYGASVVGTPVFLLIVAGVLLFIFNTIFGAQLAFRQVFAVTCYGMLPTVISTVLAIVVMFLKNPDDFNVRNPTAFNIGAFLDPQTTSKGLLSLATSLDLFNIWIVLLLATGLSVASRKLSWSKALAGVMAPWIILIAVKSASAAIFG